MPSLPTSPLALITCLSLFPCGLWADPDRYDPASPTHFVAQDESMDNVCRRYAVTGPVCEAPGAVVSGIVGLNDGDADGLHVERVEVERAFKAYLGVLSACGANRQHSNVLSALRVQDTWGFVGALRDTLPPELVACVVAGVGEQDVHPKVDHLVLFFPAHE